jgi:hypothetical protein
MSGGALKLENTEFKAPGTKSKYTIPKIYVAMLVDPEFT